MVLILRLAYKIHDSPHCPQNLKGLHLSARSYTLVLAYFPLLSAAPPCPLPCDLAPSQAVWMVTVMVVMMVTQVPLAFTEYQELSMVLEVHGLQSSQQPHRFDCVNPSYICEDMFREMK